jgi:ferredoxin-type protein NapH
VYNVGMSTFKLAFNPVLYPLHTWRRLVLQPFFLMLAFLSPVLGLLQFDVVQQRLIFLNAVYPLIPKTLLWLPVAFFSAVLIIAVAAPFFGRVFCGWVCPHNTLTEWTYSLRSWMGMGLKSYRRRRLETRYPSLKIALPLLSMAWVLLLTFLISCLFSFYFIPLPWYWEHFTHGSLPVAVWSGQILLMLIGLFMVFAGHDFCRSACPYGLSQALSAYISPLWTPMEIGYAHGEDISACNSCGACQSICPVDIDPRNPKNLMVGIGEGCFNCGECIDACQYVQAKQKTPQSGFLRFVTPLSAASRIRAPRDLAE